MGREFETCILRVSIARMHMRQHSSINRWYMWVIVDSAVCKTEGKAKTNPLIFRPILSALTEVSLFLCLPLSQTHTTVHLRTTIPACASLTSTVHNKIDKLKKKWKARTRQTERERCRAKFMPLSPGFLLSFSLLKPETHTIHTNEGSTRRRHKWRTKWKGTIPTTWLSKYQSSLPLAPSLAHLLCRELKTRCRQAEQGWQQIESEHFISLILYSWKPVG